MPDSKTRNLQSQARKHANDFAEKTRDSVKSRMNAEAENLRDTTAEEVEQGAQAAQAAADKFDSGSMQAQASAHIANTLEGVAERVRSTDLEQLAGTIGDLARRNPVMFVGGATLLGFAATRFLKSQPQDASTPGWPISENTRDAGSRGAL